MEIRRLGAGESPPMALLLLADPSPTAVGEYISRGQCFVGEMAGSVVGVYVLLAKRPDVVELVNVAVSETEQGKGLGKRLVLHAIGQARKGGYRTVEVGTGSTGVVQLALYQKCGFRMTAIDRDYFVRNYDEPIYENGIRLRDRVLLSQDLETAPE